MPWTPKQNRFFRAIEHGWRPPGGGGPSKKDATRMAHEGVISPHAAEVKRKIQARHKG